MKLLRILVMIAMDEVQKALQHMSYQNHCFIYINKAIFPPDCATVQSYSRYHNNLDPDLLQTNGKYSSMVQLYSSNLLHY